jgi:hypothetical protein
MVLIFCADNDVVSIWMLRSFVLTCAFCFLSLSSYFVLTPADLDEWALDPEAFHHEQDLIQCKEKLRPCAESLYLALFESHRELLAPVVVEILKQALEGCPPAAPGADVIITPALLLKEAAYNAVGAANYDLHDYIDLKSWLVNLKAHLPLQRQVGVDLTKTIHR